ncbi:MAG: hypothetical protein ACM65K_15450 [Microcoleus sp.]
MDQETGFLPKYLGGDAKVIAETRFLDSGRGAIAWIEKPGFFLNISVGCKSYWRNPVSARGAIAWIEKPGFFLNISVGCKSYWRNPVSARGAIAWIEKPGFFLNISVGCKSYRRNPVSGLWGKGDRVDRETGFLPKYLGRMQKLLEKPGFCQRCDRVD